MKQPRLKRDQLTQAIVRELLHYDAATGQFKWQYRVRNSPLYSTKTVRRFNLLYADKPAFTTLNGSYRMATVLNSYCRASHIAWLYMKGELPQHPIQHRNGNLQDDRFENLAEGDGPIRRFGGRPSKSRRPLTRKLLREYNKNRARGAALPAPSHDPP